MVRPNRICAQKFKTACASLTLFFPLHYALSCSFCHCIYSLFLSFTSLYTFLHFACLFVYFALFLLFLFYVLSMILNFTLCFCLTIFFLHRCIDANSRPTVIEKIFLIVGMLCFFAMGTYHFPHFPFIRIFYLDFVK